MCVNYLYRYARLRVLAIILLRRHQIWKENSALMVGNHLLGTHGRRSWSCRGFAKQLERTLKWKGL